LRSFILHRKILHHLRFRPTHVKEVFAALHKSTGETGLDISS